MAYPEVPHFSFPLRKDARGNLVTVEQDSDEEIIDCVEVLLSTPVGLREEVPTYGLPDQTFRMNGADLEQIASVIGRWEPRAEHHIERDSPIMDLIDRVRVNVTERENG